MRGLIGVFSAGMAVCRFRVIHIGIQANLRGQEMRLVRLHAVDSDPFLADDVLPLGVPPPPPSGEIAMLVSQSYAKTITLGDELALEHR